MYLVNSRVDLKGVRGRRRAPSPKEKLKLIKYSNSKGLENMPRKSTK